MGNGSTAEPPINGSPETQPSTEIDDVLMALWQKRRPEVVADLERLVAFLIDWDERSADSETRAKVVALAHQLHGIFGIFGWQDLKGRLGTVELGLISAEPSINELITTVRSVASNLP
jgi:hypothetical protein